MIAASAAVNLKQNQARVAKLWDKRAAELLGAERARALDGGESAALVRAVTLAADNLKGELKLDDLQRWAADVARVAHGAGLRSDQLLGWFITGRTAVRDFMLEEHPAENAADTQALFAAAQRNARFFDQAALFALSIHDAEVRGRPHPTDAPHLFK